MDFSYMGVATLERHRVLSRAIYGDLLINYTNAYISKEDCNLVYTGERYNDWNYLSLVDIENVGIDMDTFVADVFDHLYSVVPDILIFHENPYLISNSTVKIAGNPDLIVEIWSKGNKKDERAFKEYLYTTAAKTEVWYLTQNSNTVKRFKGKTKLKSLNLKNKLTTENGLCVDLRNVAL
ncbi:MAG: Uma2 family endonuclease [Defluviitaleaceae bacterium]|nr:Uma2 family endonuclease [Defluviitaleaceae bacterium]